eukprot:6202626-Pleurochrysis_carterae.AAC.1
MDNGRLLMHNMVELTSIMHSDVTCYLAHISTYRGRFLSTFRGRVDMRAAPTLAERAADI